MVALLLGLLLILGILSVFSDVSTANKMQNSVARLQENGRFALTRLTQDLRMMAGQYCDNTSGTAWTPTSDGGVYAGNAIMSNVASLSSLTSNGAFPDSGGTAGLAPDGWTSGTVYPVSPATFIAGYTCALDGSCTPQVPGQSPSTVDGLPGVGTTAGTRVKGADVLMLRYQSGTGWPFVVSGTGSSSVITLAPMAADAALSLTGDDPVNFIASGDRALLTKCGGGVILKVDRSGLVLTPTAGSLLSESATLPSGGTDSFDSRVFNFSRDFVTVTYYLIYKDDPNSAGRVIPTLMRKLNGGVGNSQANGDEIVEGVERLNFSFGAQYADGSLHFLSAADVSANSSAVYCPPVPEGWNASVYATDANCLWRAVQSVQINLLLDTVDNQYNLSDSDVAYRYSVDSAAMSIPPSASQPMTYQGVANGSAAGRMIRREFIGVVNIRNNSH